MCVHTGTHRATTAVHGGTTSATMVTATQGRILGLSQTCDDDASGCVTDRKSGTFSFQIPHVGSGSTAHQALDVSQPHCISDEGLCLAGTVFHWVTVFVAWAGEELELAGAYLGSCCIVLGELPFFPLMGSFYSPEFARQREKLRKNPKLKFPKKR